MVDTPASENGRVFGGRKDERHKSLSAKKGGLSVAHMRV